VLVGVMSIRIAQTSDGVGFDFAVSDGTTSDAGIETDDGLETAVIRSLFEDARATAEELREAGMPEAEQGGWWGDAYNEVEGDAEGSKLWLLARSKKTEETLARAKSYAEDALAWLFEDEVASAVDVEATWLYGVHRGLLILVIDITRLDGERWRSVWNAISGDLLESTMA
jgi:phage gp46-like protein